MKVGEQVTDGPIIGKISVDSSGRVLGSDNRGYSYTGSVQIIDASFNVYQVNLRIQAAGQLDSIPSGLGLVMDTVSIGDTFLFMGLNPGANTLFTYTLSR